MAAKKPRKAPRRKTLYYAPPLIRTNTGMKPEPRSLKGFGTKQKSVIQTNTGNKPAPRTLKDRGLPPWALGRNKKKN